MKATACSDGSLEVHAVAAVIPAFLGLRKSKGARMSKTPYMPLWVADFLADVQELDAKEVGAYMLLLMSLWQRGGTLPNDQAKLKRVARVGRDWPKVWANIEGYFEVDGDTISNPRLTAELDKARTKSTRAAQSGALGGRAKALKSKEQGLANATNSLKQPEPYLKKDTLEADASKGADAPFDAPVDATKEAIWKRGVPFLVERGVKERQARSQIGKWLREHGSSALFDALKAAAEAGTHDPIPYIERALRPQTNADVMARILKATEHMEGKS